MHDLSISVRDYNSHELYERVKICVYNFLSAVCKLFCSSWCLVLFSVKGKTNNNKGSAVAQW